MTLSVSNNSGSEMFYVNILSLYVIETCIPSTGVVSPHIFCLLFRWPSQHLGKLNKQIYINYNSYTLPYPVENLCCELKNEALFLLVCHIGRK